MENNEKSDSIEEKVDKTMNEVTGSLSSTTITPSGNQLQTNIPLPEAPLDWYYKMDHPKRGLAIIFNHENFDTSPKSRRDGTNKDSERLKDILSFLDFEIWPFTDLSYNDINKILEKAAAYDFKDCDCFLLAVMTHGDENSLDATDLPYDYAYLWNRFSPENCPGLKNKPKIFIIQACRGTAVDCGLELIHTDGYLSTKVPKAEDFLLAYSTIPEHVSWRTSGKGSWFIQVLCDQLNKHVYNWDLISILTLTSRVVATEYESYCPEDTKRHEKLLMPCTVSSLTRLIQFDPKKLYRMTESE